MVRDLRRDIDRPRRPLQRVEEIRKAFPIPIEALGEDRPGDVFNALHQVDQSISVIGTRRRKTDPAIAEQDRRYAVP